MDYKYCLCVWLCGCVFSLADLFCYWFFLWYLVFINCGKLIRKNGAAGKREICDAAADGWYLFSKKYYAICVGCFVYICHVSTYIFIWLHRDTISRIFVIIIWIYSYFGFVFFMNRLNMLRLCLCDEFVLKRFFFFNNIYIADADWICKCTFLYFKISIKYLKKKSSFSW